MKKFKYIFGAFLLAGSVASCNFLDREPMDFGDENAYYKTVDDLELAVTTSIRFFLRWNIFGAVLMKMTIPATTNAATGLTICSIRVTRRLFNRQIQNGNS